ncbi:lysylphosphatidylglycerol biosynthesis bifunctional LysX domain protein [Mycobacterium kansasii 662]|uniref:Lysylphosphatidylglycerol biosynthesis bifunctional LysX domain protein n=1 Tax=Mycobacterium kansasii 662 TaxID=1299326 RepID=X7XS30_MYCKA|nr:lysylphosphatidylglycerol biosynthesis bifunctional LysX domain protein [Mycobacterium kansasii 662]
MPRYACYEDARLIPKVGVASVIAEGFLVLPFSRRNKAHTGHHPAVPEPLAATGLLHHDGSAPDITELQQVDLADDEVGRRLPEQVRVRLNKLKTLRRNGIDAYPVGRSPSHTSRTGDGRGRQGHAFGVRTHIAGTPLRRRVVRAPARLDR